MSLRRSPLARFALSPRHLLLISAISAALAAGCAAGGNVGPGGGALIVAAALLVLAACEAKIPTAREVNDMDVASLEKSASRVFGLANFNNAYNPDQRWVIPFQYEHNCVGEN